MLLIETEIGQSEIHGTGLFCRDVIPKGTKVWEFNPLVDVVIDEASLASLPTPMHTFLNMYAYRSIETGQLIINIDLARHMNHSDRPTLVSDSQSNYFAAMDLKPGTELTCNYHEFTIEHCGEFLHKK